MYKKIPLAGPWITRREIEYATDAAQNGWYEHYHDYIDRFEQEFASYTGAKHALATFSGTHALHLCTLSLGLGPEDEVIVADQSFIATAQTVTYTGAKCVFVDIEPDNLCIDPAKIEEAVTPRTKAVMLAHLAGFCADMDAVTDIAKRHGLAVIEDACQAVGVKYKGRHVGTIGDVGAFSFQGSKIAVSGEGGVFITNDSGLYEKAKHLANFCRNDAVAFLWADGLGYKYRMANVTAAIALAQTERLSELIDNKKRIYRYYHELFAGSGVFHMLSARPFCESNYAYATGYLDDSVEMERDDLLHRLWDMDIQARPGNPSMSLMPGYDRRFSLSAADKYSARGLILPTPANLTREDAEYVCRSINEILRRKA